MVEKILSEDKQQNGPDSGTVNYEQLELDNLCREFVYNLSSAISGVHRDNLLKQEADLAAKLLSNIVSRAIEHTVGCMLHGIDNPEQKFYRAEYLVERCDAETGKITADAGPYVTILEAYNLSEAQEVAKINGQKMGTNLKRLTVVDVQEATVTIADD